jgi:hypothetical protein
VLSPKEFSRTTSKSVLPSALFLGSGTCAGVSGKKRLAPGLGRSKMVDESKVRLFD